MNSTGPSITSSWRAFSHRLILALGCAIAVRLQAQVGPSPMSRYLSRGGELSQPNAPVRPFVICFPPTPPPLDRAFVHLALSMPPRLTPPPELAACVNEPFYA